MSAAAQTVATTAPVVVTIGNPNTGKSTLFNQLTGLSQKVSNFPGVTVEQVAGRMMLGDQAINLVDVPGTYSLAAASPDEMIALDVLHGAVPGLARPAAVIVVVDASNLRRNLFLATQVMESGLPVLIALNMVDRLESTGVTLDYGRLAQELGVPVEPIVAADGTGIPALKQSLEALLAQPQAAAFVVNPQFDAAVDELLQAYAPAAPVAAALEYRRALIDADGYAEQRLCERHGDAFAERLRELRRDIGGGRSLAAIEARDRYSRIQAVLQACETRSDPRTRPIHDRLDAVLNHPLLGSLLFAALMAIIFQAVFAWAGPMVDGIDFLTGALASSVGALLGDSLFTSFLTDGVIAGVGSVVVFLPQILILFAFIIVLEDSGYMARAAFMMDRVMRGMGLTGQAFIPMLSSFACAVPGIMGTRIIANPYDRLATIMAAPFMTCSARLPVYSLLIAAFIPDTRYLGGTVNLQGLVLFGLYMLGILGGALTAWLISRLYWRRNKSQFLLEMPPYRMPQLRAVLLKLLSRAWIFLRRAGTIIFTVAIIIWALASFPRAPASAEAAAPVALEQSYLGQMSRTVQPLFAPLGWDWKITAAVLASFPAREVVIAALGTIYAVDADAADATGTLTSRISNARHPDGSPVFTLPMVLGLLIFYAFCLQCAATIAIMRRETGTWRWPIFAWFYMTGLGYAGAFIAFRLGSAL